MSERANTIKMISRTDDELRVGNHMVLWGSPEQRDLSGIAGYVNADGSGGEYFTPNTDFESEFTRAGRLLVDWEHRQDEQVGEEVLGTVDWKSARMDDEGLWVERVLLRRSRYVQMLEDLIDAGLIGSSSEAVGNVEKGDDGEIKRWPLFRDSLTVTPMEPRMLTVNQITALKNAAAVIPALAKAIGLMETGEAEADGEEQGEAGETAADVKLEAEDAPQQESAGRTTIPAEVKTTTTLEGGKGEMTMSDEKNTPEAEQKEDRLGKLETMMENLGKSVSTILAAMQDEPGVRKAGFYSQDGGGADKQVKSFADYLLAIQRGDRKRLHEVYGSYQGKAMNEATGGDGGYLVPTEYNNQLLKIGFEQSAILRLVNPIPVASDAGQWPYLDYMTAPTAGSGNTAMAAGVKATKSKEAGALTETTPAVEMMSWRLHKVGGYTQVTNELASDSPQAIEMLLTQLFGIAVASKKEYYILRGNGVGEPLGILNSAAAVGVTPTNNSVWAYQDAANMIARFKRISGNARFVQHPSIIPDYAATGWTQGNNVININGLGYGDTINSEHLPQADNSGCVLLADFGAYVVFEKGSLEIAFSEHYGFVNDLGTWRFTARMDGMPWLKSAVTLADPQGSYTVSPFVYFND